MILNEIKPELSADEAVRVNRAIDAMEVNPLIYPIDGYTHIGVMRMDGMMVKYLGRMIDDLFQFDPATRRVVQYI
jgi:hypothetical protein